MVWLRGFMASLKRTDARSRRSAHQRGSNTLGRPLSRQKYEYPLLRVSCTLASLREINQPLCFPHMCLLHAPQHTASVRILTRSE